MLDRYVPLLARYELGTPHGQVSYYFDLLHQRLRVVVPDVHMALLPARLRIVTMVGSKITEYSAPSSHGSVG